ncbi:MAG: TRAP transporter large permease subunit [Deltaproteobacteria bacterium]|nr:TRAP transporter large permease subunit [Deltaproteobacteria bacterium]MBW1929316.1 TRAP transporter large permease subunit [Deltaproteobacteria bacterium]MBW2026996.1 TRAP transporter large permease subunit [Deltaproteobacteria bacterium]MBW2127178.1 TRAP transporter large permease subunit [Deltaproteobacteria bacterium]RLB22512.1 MAG: C4-dicarboxylate ABC transporter [Deltaproteobacteria bacterium]
MGTEISLLLLFGGLLVGVFLGFPVAFVMLGSGLLVGLFGGGPSFIHTLLLRAYAVMEHYELVAIPLFVYMGMMLSRSGAAERLFSAFHIALGGLRGGLAITTVVICTIMAAATGIVGASVVSMGLFALPAMLKRNYDPALSTGAVCAGGTLGILIPPSVMLVVYGPMASLSVGKLFMGAVFPGLLLSLLYILYIAVKCYFRPELGPPLPASQRDIGLKKKLWLMSTSLIPTLFVILAVMGSIFFGVAAPTEAAAMGAAASILLAAFYRKLDWKTLKESIFESLKVVSMIMWTVIGAFVFTGAFMVVGGGELVETALLGLKVNPTTMLLIMGLAFLLLGFVMEWVGIIPILVPIFSPVIMDIGLDPLWAGIVFCMIMQTSFLTPPMAPTLFYLKGVSPPEISFGKHIVRGIIPFLILQLVGVAIVILVPQLALWFPAHMIK